MNDSLQLTIGQYSDKGRKTLNQDFHGAYIPSLAQRAKKGVALAIADGISSSPVSHIASETAVSSFLSDYYCTSDAWSVKHAGLRVLKATNAWLYSHTQRSEGRYYKDKGYVCTLSALVIKADTAHLFHLGDSRIYRLNSAGLEQLTKDHRLWVNDHKSYLSRALGMVDNCDFDYHACSVREGDLFILATDGVYEFINAAALQAAVKNSPTDLDRAAREIAEQAYEAGSSDNLTIQIVRVDKLPVMASTEVKKRVDNLPLPPMLSARMSFDGYRIIRELHATSRSHIYLAQDESSGKQVVIKIPSIDKGSDPEYLERFISEEWAARRINSAHVLRAELSERPRNYLYTVFEYIEGQTLAQWITDNPQPKLNQVREIVEQIAKGLAAFHRMDMLHQDIKPDNIIIDEQGTVKIIDFGSVWVAGLAETQGQGVANQLLGTALYTAPEYFLGASGSVQSELFSLGVITYYMLSGRFPYGTKVSAARTLAAQRRLSYHSVLDEEREIPIWIDDAIRRAVHPFPQNRYGEISEFIADLRKPNSEFLYRQRRPLLERDPVAVWKGISLLLSLCIVYLLVR